MNNTILTAAEHVLKAVATDPDYYAQADPNTISSKIQNVYNKVAPAVENASLVEVPNSTVVNTGSIFSFSDSEEDGKTDLVVSSIDNDTGIVTYKPISYEIKIDKTAKSDVYDTNDTSATKIVVGNDPKLVINESPSVKWDRPSYGYTVNYYKDNGTERTLLTDLTDTETGELSTVIPYENYDYSTNPELTELKGYKIDHLENAAGDTIDELTVSENANANVLNVIYTKKTDIKYHVVYHYEGTNTTGEEVESDPTVYYGTYEEKISGDKLTAHIEAGLKDNFVYNSHRQMPEPNNGLDVEPTVNELHIFYTREEYPYCINYYYDDDTDAFEVHNRTGKYGNTVTYDAPTTLKPGYVLDHTDPVSGEIIIGANTNNIIKVFYIKGRYAFTVDYFIDNGDSTCTKVGNTYTGSKQEFGTTYTLTDSELNKEKPEGYEIKTDQRNTIEITEVEANNHLDVYYVIGEYGFSVDYYKNSISEANHLGSQYTGTAVFGSNKVLTQEELEREIIPGYKLSDDQVKYISITANADNNHLDVIYVRDSYNYCVNYYYDDEEDSSVRDSGKAEFESLISYQDKVREGYELTAIDPTTGEIIIGTDSSKNVINVFYNRMLLSYTVLYYYGGVLDESKTETEYAKYHDIITEYDDKVIDGYEFDKVEGLGLEIGIFEEENVIKVYYKALPVEEPIPNTGVEGMNELYRLLFFVFTLFTTALYIDKKKVTE